MGSEPNEIRSPSCDAVMAASHPSPDDGGPCATCAFRSGTIPNQSCHTMILARLCVEGLRLFLCHEKSQVCRGYIAAINLRGVPQTKADQEWCDMAGLAADVLGDAIAEAAKIQQAKETSNGS